MSIATKPKQRQGKEPLIILGIESSCDETAVAVLSRSLNGNPARHTKILSSLVAHQDEEHAPFGGVVPEIAARAHLQKIDGLIGDAVKQAGINYTDLDAIAATSGPGLIGGVITGLMSAKGLAMALDIPLIAINHLEGHALSPRLSAQCPFPYLLLLVSGGHTQLLSVKGLGDYQRLGSTVDDAAGEAFDKTAKVLGLGFPGGPKVEATAQGGQIDAYDLPRPFKGKNHADFSFAGLKTATARAWESSDKTQQNKIDLAASFQHAVCEVLGERSAKAMDMFIKQNSAANPNRPRRFVVAGGVASNQAIRAKLEILCQDKGFELIAPPLKFCTDNAAMIALAGIERYLAGQRDPLSVKALPRWPLDQMAAKMAPASGSGKKGPKS